MVEQKLNRWLSPKSLRSAYGVKACVMLITIHLSDGDVKPGGSPEAFC